jgi:hypothetical protein
VPINAISASFPVGIVEAGDVGPDVKDVAAIADNDVATVAVESCVLEQKGRPVG